jgi:hypothetical protein
MASYAPVFEVKGILHIVRIERETAILIIVRKPQHETDDVLDLDVCITRIPIRWQA